MKIEEMKSSGAKKQETGEKFVLRAKTFLDLLLDITCKGNLEEESRRGENIYACGKIKLLSQ